MFLSLELVSRMDMGTFNPLASAFVARNRVILHKAAEAGGESFELI